MTNPDTKSHNVEFLKTKSYNIFFIGNLLNDIGSQFIVVDDKKMCMGFKTFLYSFWGFNRGVKCCIFHFKMRHFNRFVQSCREFFLLKVFVGIWVNFSHQFKYDAENCFKFKSILMLKTVQNTTGSRKKY